MKAVYIDLRGVARIFRGGFVSKKKKKIVKTVQSAANFGYDPF